MSAKWDRSWTRIGRYDRPRRRSTWARIEYAEGPPRNGLYMATEDAVAVELCAGREGDDAFARVERGDPSFGALLEVVDYALANVDEEPDADECRETAT